ncbi:MAG: DUF2460 domain-containing protein [Bryobacteraceae bacterium]
MNFPTLKSGAIMQYPAERAVAFATRTLRFLDGNEQRYLLAPARRQWLVRLDLLDEDEANAIEEFFLAMQGRGGSFAFTDPWDGTEYPNCSLADDDIEVRTTGLDRGRLAIMIRENRD